MKKGILHSAEMFETFTAIAMLVVFLVPGYLWRWTEEQFVYLNHRLPWEKLALGLLVRSTFAYLPFYSFIYHLWRHVPGTKGIYLAADEISTIELIEYEPGPPNPPR